jgi:lysozyme
VNINEAGLALIKESEGLSLKAYRCPAGVLTIGYGSTGAWIKPGMVITRQRAEELLKQDLKRFELGVNAQLGGVPTTDNQRSAMVSLAFNIGLGAFARSSVLRNHKARKYQAAANSFLLWVKAGNKTLSGLVTRRKRERALYLK